MSSDGIRIAGMTYQAVIVDGLRAAPRQAMEALNLLNSAGRLIVWEDNEVLGLPTSAIKVTTAEALIDAIDRLTPPDLVADPKTPDLRYRHVIRMVHTPTFYGMRGCRHCRQGLRSPRGAPHRGSIRTQATKCESPHPKAQAPTTLSCRHTSLERRVCCAFFT